MPTDDRPPVPPPGHPGRAALGVTCATLLFLFTPFIHAQSAPTSFSGRLDVEVTTRRLWHGLTRVSGIASQTQAQLGIQRGRLSAAAGALAVWDICDCGLGNVRLRGERRHGLGELDLWGEGRVALGAVSIGSGAVRYTFHGDATRGGIDKTRNTTEIFTLVELRQIYLSPRVATWIDVGPVGGTYFELGAALPLLGWPYPPFKTIYLDGQLGYNLSQGPNKDDPGQLANYAERGFTHARLALAGDILTGGSVRLSAGLQFELNFDDAVQGVRRQGSSDLDFGVWLGGSWQAPLGAKTQ
jgi:hypothetical protein